MTGYELAWAVCQGKLLQCSKIEPKVIEFPISFKG